MGSSWALLNKPLITNNMKITMNHKDVIIDIYDLIELIKSDAEFREGAIIHLKEYLLGIGEDVDLYCDVIKNP